MTTQNFDPRAWVNAWNTHSIERVMESYSEDAEVRTPEAPSALRGKQAIRENVQGWLRSFPDVTADVEHSIVSGRDVALLCHFSGTNRGEIVLGPGRSLPATNKKVEMPVAIFATLDATGKIVRERDIYDVAGYLQQLGIPTEELERATAGRTMTRSR